jgi:hypothetical protein
MAYGAPLFPRRQCRVGQKDRNESQEIKVSEHKELDRFLDPGWLATGLHSPQRRVSMAHPVRCVRPAQNGPAHSCLYQRAICIAVLGNGTLVLTTGAAAWLSGSTAVLTTAVDSYIDLVVGDEIPFLVAHPISNAVRGAVEALDEVVLAFVHLEPAQLHSGAQP